MTELLSSAATGLSEFAQPSSSDDDQVELRGHTNNHQDFPSNMIQQPPHELAKNETTDKVYATEYNDPVLSHLVKPDHADDIFLSSSTSGSMGSETDKRLGSSTYTRPKLPWALTNQQASGSPRGKILPFYPQQNTTVPHQHLQNYDGLPDTQNLISQLEKRTVLDKKQKDTDNHKERSLSNSPCGVTEDQEVANVMLGSAHTAGLNQRLLAMLQRRKNIQSIFETNQKMDTHNLLRTQPRRSAVVPSSARTQSQQPISRLSEGLNSERRRDSSLLTLRTTSQNRNLSSRRETKFPEKHSVQASIAKARTNSSQPHRVGDTPRSTSANTRVTFGDPPSMGGSSDGSKLSAIQTWQRRKTYDPHASSQPKTSKESIRSTNQSGRVGKSQDQTSERLTNSAYQPTKNGQRTSRRLMNGLNRTAPVETADCLEALASIEAHTEFPAHCSVVPKILLQNQSQNRSEMVPATHQSKTRSETARKPTVTNAPSSVDGKRRQARSASSHSQYPSLMGQQRRNEPHICLTNGSRQKTERSYQPLTNGHSRTGKHHTNLLHSNQMRSVSQAEYREFEETGPIPDVTACFDSNGKANLDNELHYPDLAVESIRYKIEKLANFIVRLRKRIERDYAEQGTCSPGDDVFGDEAVGATVAGMSTGMHPVVAASLKHLRVLEFNAQEIFNLLYPNEIDLWEPVRACLAGTIEGEQMYNEARSKLTDHASNSMNMDDIIKEGTIRRNETVAFDPDSYTSPDNNEYIPLHHTDIL
ncbi:hypothetical protein T265_08803 [Opisthorchis viverrini]|uniref:Uncharacterized protein n=1 Tax=Opisthorchis viverrini TaxID=6198 RepID=A0A074Z7U6_OPIVI|nr:hypothetical protein T265_08803 [Opisthorchis viverrini]KER23266.1 hypothetical protein T265_08803 [Opisthorchis viverrini]